MRSGWERRLWPLVTFVTVIGIWSFVLWATEKCSSPEFIGSPATGCFEFWVNRYQTLFAAGIALAAALIALAPVKIQIAEMKKQSAMQIYSILVQRRARMQIDKMAVWDAKLEALYALMFENDYDDASITPPILKTWADELELRIQSLKSLENILREVAVDEWGDNKVITSRLFLGRAVLALRYRITAFSGEVKLILLRNPVNAPITSVWIADKKALKEFTAKSEAAELDQRSDAHLTLLDAKELEIFPLITAALNMVALKEK